MLGDAQSAVADYSKAIEFDLDNPQHWNGADGSRASAYAKLGRWEEPRQDYATG